MVKDRKGKLLQVLGCLMCAAVQWKISRHLSGTEFEAGRISGPFLNLGDGGAILFVVALALTYVLPRVAAVAALLASVCCLPLYFLLTFPFPVVWLFHGQDFHPARLFVWNVWPVVGIGAVGLTAYFCLRRLRSRSGLS